MYTNPASEHLFGYTQEEITKLHYRDLIHPDDLDVSSETFVKAKQSNQAGSITTNRRYVTKDGTSIQTRGATSTQGRVTVTWLRPATWLWSQPSPRDAPEEINARL